MKPEETLPSAGGPGLSEADLVAIAHDSDAIDLIGEVLPAGGSIDGVAVLDIPDRAGAC